MTTHVVRLKLFRLKAEGIRMRNDWRDFHRASHEAEIMMEILRHGSEVDVLEPKWLRDKVKEEIKKNDKKILDIGRYMSGVEEYNDITNIKRHSIAKGG